MRWREFWPALSGLGIGLVILVATFLFDRANEQHILGIGIEEWFGAALVLCAGLAGQLFLSGRLALHRERRLVHAAARMQELTARLELLATTDTLTGLYNRRVFFERLGLEYRRAIRYGHPLSVLMADLDHFKDVNDQYGHPFGDMVISVTAQTIRTNVRESDIVARYGGEEFVLMLPETAQAEALIVAEKLRGAVAAQQFTDGINNARMTISVGVASMPTCVPTNDEDLVRLADQALYEAKHAGRNRAVAAAPAVASD